MGGGSEIILAQDVGSAQPTAQHGAALQTEGPADQKKAAGEAGATRTPGTISLNRAQRRDLEQARRRAADLTGQSQSAFERGLMPFADYLEQEALVQWTEQLLSDVRFAGSSVSVRRQHLARMQTALNQLRQFNQPNAKHWEADVALAEWAVADAELELAREERGGAATLQAALRRSESAREHRRLRLRDADVGWASLQDTSLASSLMVSSTLPDAPGRDVSASDHRTYLTFVAERTAGWSRDGAGIGRADRVQASKLAVDLDELAANLQSDRKDRAQQSMRRADRGIRELFATQREFHEKGTASLYDVCRTWLAWRELHEMGAGQPDLVDAGQLAERQQARATLSGLADQTLDQRGRNAADITVVRLAEQMDDLETLRRPEGQSGDYLKPPEVR
jgi:hypothetical protein